MSFLIVLITCLAFSYGCTKTNEKEIDLDIGNTKISLHTLSANPQQRIKDLNIYAYNCSTSLCIKHVYSLGEKDIDMILPMGQYEIFVFANAGKDIGDNLSIYDAQQLKFKLVTISDEYLPMFGSVSLLLLDNVSKEITLNNCTARIAFNIKISDKINNMIIQKITLKSISMTGMFSSPETKADDFCDIPYDFNPCRQFSDTVFIAENCAGTNSSITSQREKNLLNAPQNASYIQINVLSETNKFLTYYVFLGENNTTDFNVKRNSSHIMNITIEGEDKIDTRMESDTITVSDNILSRCLYSSCYPIPANNYKISFSKTGSTSSKRFSSTVQLLEGDANYFTINQQKQSSELDLGNLDCKISYQIGYNPPLISASNCSLCYRVVLRSSDGNVYQEDFRRTFANLLKIRYNKKYGTLDNSYGSGYKYYKDDTVIILVPNNKITLKAKCEDGCALDGWYDENGVIITQNELYSHTLSSYNEVLTMNFKKEKTYIYTNLDEVQVRCLKKDPDIDHNKQAYIVDFSAYCEIRPKDLSKVVEGWYDENGKLITSDPNYNFNASDNIHIYPRFK